MSLAQLSEHPFLPVHPRQSGTPTPPSDPISSVAAIARVSSSSALASSSCCIGSADAASVRGSANPHPASALPGSSPQSTSIAVTETKSQDVDDRSYVLIDPAFVEVNILADSVERRMRVSPGTGRNPTELVAVLEQVVGSAVRFDCL